MKRILYLLPLSFIGMILFFAECSKERLSNSTSSYFLNKERSVFTRSYSDEVNHPDYSVSREMVESFINNTSKREQTQYSITAYPSEENPVLFIVNFEEGWKIVPGDSRFGLILAESATGHIDLYEIMDNPGLHLWIEDYQLQIESARKDNWWEYS